VDILFGDNARHQEDQSMTSRSNVPGPRRRRSFTREYKAEAVRLCRLGDRSIGKVAKDLAISETALRRWIEQSDIDAGQGPPEALTTDERRELAELRRQNRTLLMEREILKKAAAVSTGHRNAW
jgi:transposase